MHRLLGTVLGLTLIPLGVAAGADAAAPVRSVTVTGEGVTTWPQWDETLTRLAIDTTEATGGSVIVTASTDDPAGEVRVDGVPRESGAPVAVSGLDPGDEVHVRITDAGGTIDQSFVFLPAGFPVIESSGPAPGPGATFLGLGSFLSESTYETVVDDHGVPRYLHEVDKAHDFKASAGHPGRYSVAHPLPDSRNDDAGYRIDELGPRYAVRRSFTLAPVRGLLPDDTDFHDVEFTDDGRVVLLGYHRDTRRSGATWLDAVIQILDRDGEPTFTWTSKGHVRPAEGYVLGPRGQDYAHINSVELRPGGDLVASFRNTGQVLRIATRAHDGFRPGDVVWRLGGERSDFTFVDDPYGGICAQHDARILPDGHLQLFDNGSRHDESGPVAPQTADMCPDPADPGGARIARPQSRVVEYALDRGAGTATLVWSHEVPGRYAPFAGNAQWLEGGHRLVGWSQAESAEGEGPAPFVTQVDAAGAEVWSLTAPGWFSYRAFRFPAPDRIPPRVILTDDEPGYRCTDRGGSGLAGCTESGGAVVATDGAGNQRTRSLA